MRVTSEQRQRSLHAVSFFREPPQHVGFPLAFIRNHQRRDTLRERHALMSQLSRAKATFAFSFGDVQGARGNLGSFISSPGLSDLTHDEGPL